MTVADTEYSQELPEQCLNFIIHTRDESLFRLAFETGKVAGPVAPYFTVLGGSRYYEPEVFTDSDSVITLYFASPSAGKIVEIIAWTG